MKCLWKKILVPNFKEGKNVSLDAFIFPVFDGGKYSVEKDTGNGELLSDNIFQCIPASCNEGTDSYKDAPLGISLSTPATIPQIENILKKDKADAMKELEQLVRDSFNASDENKFYFVACDNEFASQ